MSEARTCAFLRWHLDEMVPVEGEMPNFARWPDPSARLWRYCTREETGGDVLDRILPFVDSIQM